MNHPRMVASPGNDVADAFLLAEVGLSDELDIKAMFTGDGLGVVVHFQAKLIGPTRVIEKGQTETADVPGHGSSVSHVNQCTRQDDTVITQKTEGNLVGMALGEVFHAFNHTTFICQ